MKLSEFKERVSEISGNLKNRILGYLLPLIDYGKSMINCHCHIFNEKTVPKTVMNMKIPYSNRFIIDLGQFMHKWETK